MQMHHLAAAQASAFLVESDQTCDPTDTHEVLVKKKKIRCENFVKKSNFAIFFFLSTLHLFTLFNPLICSAHADFCRCSVPSR